MVFERIRTKINAGTSVTGKEEKFLVDIEVKN